MDYENAEKIHNLVESLKTLDAELYQFSNYTSIDGHLNDGRNGLGFHWDNTDRHFRYIIEGINRDIENIQRLIKEA